MDSTILEKFQAGDHRAFNAVFEHFVHRIKYFCFRLIGQKEDAEEIALQTFHKLFNIHDKFATQNNIQAFLYITARNACFDYLRTQRRKQEKEQALIANLAPPVQDDILEIETELLHIVYQEIAKLPPACKQVFTLLYVKDLTPKEVATEMNISVDNVYKQKRRAIEIIRTSLPNLSFLFLLSSQL